MTVPYGVGLPVANGGRFAAISSRAAGSGRTADFTFPDPLQMLTTASAPTQSRNRMNSSTLAVTVGGVGGGGASLGVRSGNSSNGNVFRGPSVRFTGNGIGAGQIARCSAGPFVFLNLLKSKTRVGRSAHDYAVTSVAATVAYDSLVGVAVQDSGLQVTIDGGRLIADTKAGFGFIRTGLNAWNLTVVPVSLGAATNYPITNPATFDETLVHKQQLVFQSATLTSDACVTAYLDGVPMKTLFWNAATIGVTVPEIATVQLGMVAQIIMQLNGNMDLITPAGFQVVQAPTLLDALL